MRHHLLDYPYYEYKIVGIPCLIAVLECEKGDDPGFPDHYDINYEVYDRKGYLAPWLEKKLTEDAHDELLQQIIDWRR